MRACLLGKKYMVLPVIKGKKRKSERKEESPSLLPKGKGSYLIAVRVAGQKNRLGRRAYGARPRGKERKGKPPRRPGQTEGGRAWPLNQKRR